MLGCSAPTTPVTSVSVPRRRSLVCCGASNPIGRLWTSFVAPSRDWPHCLRRSARLPPGNGCSLSLLPNADRRLDVGAREQPEGSGQMRETAGARDVVIFRAFAGEQISAAKSVVATRPLNGHPEPARRLGLVNAVPRARFWRGDDGTHGRTFDISRKTGEQIFNPPRHRSRGPHRPLHGGPILTRPRPDRSDQKGTIHVGGAKDPRTAAAQFGSADDR